MSTCNREINHSLLGESSIHVRKYPLADNLTLFDILRDDAAGRCCLHVSHRFDFVFFKFIKMCTSMQSHWTHIVVTVWMKS